MKSKLFLSIKIFFSSNHSRDDGYVKFLTKGDNNNVDDRGLYSPGQLWLEQKDVIGRARGYFSFSFIFYKKIHLFH